VSDTTKERIIFSRGAYYRNTDASPIAETEAEVVLFR